MDYIELTAIIKPLEVGRDILTAELASLGFESFVDTNEGLQAYIQEKNFEKVNIAQVSILKQTDFKIDFTIKTIKDQNWNEVWEKTFDPINVEDRCYIRAPFHDKKENILFDIVIEPKMSFGTGHHETTYLMVNKILDLQMDNKDVLDMGCGTGVLAILAKHKGANNVTAIDIDEWAYQNTIENIQKNGELLIDVIMGGADVIPDIKYDAIFANINRNILLENMSNYARSIKNKGSLLLSGFFISDKEVLLNEANKNKLTLMESTTKNDWTLLHLIKE